MTNNTDSEVFVRDRCTFYESWEDAISILNRKEQGILRRAIIRSLLYGENYEKDIEKLTNGAKIAWKTIVPLIKNARRKAEGGTTSKVNNPNGNNQYSYNQIDNNAKEDKIEDKKRLTIKKGITNIKSTSVITRTRTREGEFSPEEEKRLSSFDKLLAEKAPTFAKSVPPISLEQLDELKAHASAQDIIEIMEEIENKVAAKEKCPYSNAATTIKTYLQTKKLWKTKGI